MIPELIRYNFAMLLGAALCFVGYADADNDESAQYCEAIYCQSSFHQNGQIAAGTGNGFDSGVAAAAASTELP